MRFVAQQPPVDVRLWRDSGTQNVLRTTCLPQELRDLLTQQAGATGSGGGGFCRRHKGRIDPSPRTYVQAVFQSLEEDPTVYMTMTMLGHSRVLLSPYAYHCNVSSPLSRTFQAWSVPI